MHEYVRFASVLYIIYIIANMRTPYSVIGKIAAVFELSLQMHQQTAWLYIYHILHTQTPITVGAL